jgi:hypothetical protein
VNQASGWYNIVNFREPYIFPMALIYRLYIEKDYSRFSEDWIPLAHTVATSRSSLKII